MKNAVQVELQLMLLFGLRRGEVLALRPFRVFTLIVNRAWIGPASSTGKRVYPMLKLVRRADSANRGSTSGEADHG